MSKTNITKTVMTIIFCLYIAAVAYLCFARPDDMPQLPQLWLGLPADKVGHFLMFMPFPLLGYLTFEVKGMSVGRKLFLIAILIVFGAGMALGTEYIQARLEYRSAENSDLLADVIGLITGGIFTLIYIFLRKGK